MDSLLAAAFTRSRLRIRITRPLRPDPGLPLRNPLGRSLPSARLVFFDGFMGTMNQSTPDLSSVGNSGSALLLTPARDQSGGPGRASHVPITTFHAWIRPSTPTERHHLA